jgi:uncharacterized protein (DUF427 family)
MSQTALKRESGYAAHPDYKVTFEPSQKRIRVIFNGETVADSRAVRLLHETKHIPVYYFPKDDVRGDLLEPSDHVTFCPFKGDASYWHLRVGGRSAENAVWSYQDPFAEVGEIKDYLAFYWDRMDRWLEEDEEVFVHARDPYVRVDILESSRPVKVVLGGETVAETTRARFLFETGLPRRFYIPREDVRGDLLEPSETRSACPYKGTAEYYSLRIGDRLHQDIAWCYPAPTPESARIKDYLSFFNEKVDGIFLEGQEVPRPRTKWS